MLQLILCLLGFLFQFRQPVSRFFQLRDFTLQQGMFSGQCLAFPFNEHFQFVTALTEFIDQCQIFVQCIVQDFSFSESLVPVFNLGAFCQYSFVFCDSAAELPDLLLPLSQCSGAFRNVFLKLEQMRPLALQ